MNDTYDKQTGTLVTACDSGRTTEGDLPSKRYRTRTNVLEILVVRYLEKGDLASVRAYLGACQLNF